MRRLQPSDLHPKSHYHPSASGPLPPLRRQQPHMGFGRPGAASFSTVAVRYRCRATSLT